MEFGRPSLLSTPDRGVAETATIAVIQGPFLKYTIPN